MPPPPHYTQTIRRTSTNQMQCGITLTPTLSSQVPPTSTVDTEWLTAALRASGALSPSGAVRAARMEPLKVKVDWAGVTGADEDGKVENGGGMSGAGVLRVAGLQYDGQGGSAPLPATMVHKWSAAGDSQNKAMGEMYPRSPTIPARKNPARSRFGLTGSGLSGVSVEDLRAGLDGPLPNPKRWAGRVAERAKSIKPGGFGRWSEQSMRVEARFYQDVGPAMEAAGVRVPACYHVGLDGPAQPTPEFLYVLGASSLCLSVFLSFCSSLSFALSLSCSFSLSRAPQMAPN